MGTLLSVCTRFRDALYDCVTGVTLDAHTTAENLPLDKCPLLPDLIFTDQFSKLSWAPDPQSSPHSIGTHLPDEHAHLARLTRLVVGTSTEKRSVHGLIEMEQVVLLTRLRCLELRGCNFDNAELDCIATLTTLTSLTIKCCANMDDAGLAALSSLTRLKNLDLSDCNSITPDGLAHLATLTTLLTLDLSNCELNVDQAR